MSGYSLGFEDFARGGKLEPLFTDVGADATMFRIVCKSNLTRALAEDLTRKMTETLAALDSLSDGYQSIHMVHRDLQEEAEKKAATEGISTNLATSVVLAAGKWKHKALESKKKHRERMAKSFTTC